MKNTDKHKNIKNTNEHVFVIRALNPMTKTPEFFTGDFNLVKFNKSQYPNKAKRYTGVMEASRVAKSLYNLFPDRSFVVERVVLKGDLIDRRGRVEVSIAGNDPNVMSRQNLNLCSVTGDLSVDSGVENASCVSASTSENNVDFSKHTGYKLFVRDKVDLCYEKAMSLGYVFTDRCNKRVDSFLYLSNVNRSATSGNNRTTFVNSIFEEITPEQLLKMSVSENVSIVDRYKNFDFQTFEKVLFKQDEFSVWQAGLFSHKTGFGKYVVIGATSPNVGFCIPYNEDTLGLLGVADKEVLSPLLF